MTTPLEYRTTAIYDALGWGAAHEPEKWTSDIDPKTYIPLLNYDTAILNHYRKGLEGLPPALQAKTDKASKYTSSHLPIDIFCSTASASFLRGPAPLITYTICTHYENKGRHFRLELLKQRILKHTTESLKRLTQIVKALTSTEGIVFTENERKETDEMLVRMTEFEDRKTGRYILLIEQLARFDYDTLETFIKKNNLIISKFALQNSYKGIEKHPKMKGDLHLFRIIETINAFEQWYDLSLSPFFRARLKTAMQDEEVRYRFAHISTLDKELIEELSEEWPKGITPFLSALLMINPCLFNQEHRGLLYEAIIRVLDEKRLISSLNISEALMALESLLPYFPDPNSHATIVTVFQGSKDLQRLLTFAHEVHKTLPLTLELLDLLASLVNTYPDSPFNTSHVASYFEWYGSFTFLHKERNHMHEALELAFTHYSQNALDLFGLAFTKEEWQSTKLFRMTFTHISTLEKNNALQFLKDVCQELQVLDFKSRVTLFVRKEILGLTEEVLNKTTIGGFARYFTIGLSQSHTQAIMQATEDADLRFFLFRRATTFPTRLFKNLSKCIELLEDILGLDYILQHESSIAKAFTNLAFAIRLDKAYFSRIKKTTNPLAILACDTFRNITKSKIKTVEYILQSYGFVGESFDSVIFLSAGDLKRHKPIEMVAKLLSSIEAYRGHALSQSRAAHFLRHSNELSHKFLTFSTYPLIQLRQHLIERAHELFLDQSILDDVLRSAFNIAQGALNDTTGNLSSICLALSRSLIDATFNQTPLPGIGSLRNFVHETAVINTIESTNNYDYRVGSWERSETFPCFHVVQIGMRTNRPLAAIQVPLMISTDTLLKDEKLLQIIEMLYPHFLSERIKQLVSSFEGMIEVVKELNPRAAQAWEEYTPTTGKKDVYEIALWSFFTKVKFEARKFVYPIGNYKRGYRYFTQSGLSLKAPPENTDRACTPLNSQLYPRPSKTSTTLHEGFVVPIKMNYRIERGTHRIELCVNLNDKLFSVFWHYSKEQFDNFSAFIPHQVLDLKAKCFEEL